MYLSVPFENGGTLLVDVHDENGTGVVRAGRTDELISSSADTFEAGLDRVRHAAEAILEKLSGLSKGPDHIRAEFGICLTAEAGMVVVKGSGDAHFTLELEWNRAPAGK
jgi:Trypsin-co-occurring domain 1